MVCGLLGCDRTAPMGGNGRRRAYCSAACKREATRVRNRALWSVTGAKPVQTVRCAWTPCDETFVVGGQPGMPRKYCGAACATMARVDRARARRIGRQPRHYEARPC